MQQFFRAKAQHPDAILFFRLGDFYEMFYDDAVVAAELLDLTLTSRSKTAAGEKIPMAGVPHHAAAGYVARLLERGQKVALCEQMADPATVRGVVPREVVRVVTPGLCVEPDALDARSHNFLATVALSEDRFGLATLELSTAELRACVLPDATALVAELVRLDPREVLLAASDESVRPLIDRLLPRATLSPDEEATPDPGPLSELIGPSEFAALTQKLPPAGVEAAARTLRYAERARLQVSLPIRRVGVYDPTDHLIVDDVAVRNLELVRSATGERSGSLLALLDETQTPMGARLLRRRLLAPLTDVAGIRRRQDGVEALVLDPARRTQVRQTLRRAGDLERLATRIEMEMATPRDLAATREGLRAAAEVAEVLSSDASAAVPDTLTRLSSEELCPELLELLAHHLVDDPPVSLHQGAVFRPGIHAELDAHRELSISSKTVILDLEKRERDRTGIASLKIKYTKVFGYYIEVTKTNLGAVPDHYRRKQTVANGERFVTEELEELQSKILNADERARHLEASLFQDLRRQAGQHTRALRTLAAHLAEIDTLASLAEVAHRYDYVRPIVDESVSVEFEDLRHPIVERLIDHGTFVPNDVALDADGTRLLMVTGPNMAGKSTAMRQVALAVLMAQAGSFVPARSGRVGLVDRIFTRVGASDNLGQGQSTFMVEMRETATILRDATHRSLVILDEIGRGTSTYDGLAIAWAVAEHLHDVLRSRTMFATHYHELCDLAADREGIANINAAAREYGREVVFLHKLVPGGANRSYGVAVARLAGVPDPVLERARALLQRLEHGGSSRGQPESSQLDLFRGAAETTQVVAPKDDIQASLRELDVDQLTPLQALVELARLKDLLGD